MGLKERRRIEEFKQKRFPELKKEIDAAAGFDVPMDVRWDTLAAEGYGDDVFADALPKVYFQPLVLAFRAICVDDMGKDALKKGLKQVVIKNEKKTYGQSAFAFEGGVLTIDHETCTNVDYVDDRVQALQGILENAL
jgi:hypothetical protein